jgi:hypothetical protein
MNAKSYLLAALVTLLVLAGCIIGDELTTLTVNPDGSAEYVIFRSNLHSTEVGEKADKEVADYKANFSARDNDEFARIEAAGGRIVTTNWLRDAAPLSNVVHARFPDASALEKFWTVRSDDGRSQIATEFATDGLHRRLTFRVFVPPDENQPAASPPAAALPVQQMLANGVSVTRFAVAGGTITAAHGFTVSADRQSAVVNNDEIADALREGHGTAELYLEWEVGT